jgi:hypothetical protein
MTEVDIANQALNRAGAEKIIALSDQTKNAIAANRFYEITRDEVLRIHPWNCAIVRQEIDEKSAATAWQATTAYTAADVVSNGDNVYECTTSGTSAGSGGPTGTGVDITDNTAEWKFLYPELTTNFDFTYELPTGWLRVLDLNGDKTIPYRIEGDLLYTNHEDTSGGAVATIRYVRQVGDPTDWDALLTEAIVTRLGSKLAVHLTARIDLSQMLFQEFVLNLGVARQVAAVEEHENPIDILQLYTNIMIAQKTNFVSEG